MKKTVNKKIKEPIIILLIIIMSLLLLYAGYFLFIGGSGDKQSDPIGDAAPEEPVLPPAGPKINPVKYVRSSETINGLKQEINILEIDPGSSDVTIQPVLSHDLIYGFELLSAMAARKSAYAAVNGGFFHDFGLPSGMVVINGELFSASTGKYPVFIIDNGKAELREISSKISIEYLAGATGYDILHVDSLNSPVSDKQIAVYTPVYGRSNRAKKRNITAAVENGTVTKVADYSGEAAIPENGMLISFFDIKKYAGLELPLRVGDTVRLVHQPELSKNAQAYECGSWLVREGKSVVREKDEWVGIMTNRDPRTAVGIKEDGTVLLLTVDGRQPGYSAGFTGKELASYLISRGVSDAAMLDGGASTEMLLDGKLVSRPSFKGQEREIAGGILILLKK